MNEHRDKTIKLISQRLNYLAHAYLSFSDSSLLTGNMISDFVKGKKKYEYPEGIQEGMTLHRQIDQFTDQHPATANARALLKPACGPYAGPFVDIIYDHFLALDSGIFPGNSLSHFARSTYEQLGTMEEFFPPRFNSFAYYMRTQDWLYHYRFREGIFNSFKGLVRRAKYIYDAQPAFAAFEKYYSELNNCYKIFFPDIKAFAYGQFLYLRPPS
jgi:acyl carrier protein phosphodiesterase